MFGFDIPPKLPVRHGELSLNFAGSCCSQSNVMAAEKNLWQLFMDLVDLLYVSSNKQLY